MKKLKHEAELFKAALLAGFGRGRCHEMARHGNLVLRQKLFAMVFQQASQRITSHLLLVRTQK